MRLLLYTYGAIALGWIDICSCLSGATWSSPSRPSHGGADIDDAMIWQAINSTFRAALAEVEEKVATDLTLAKAPWFESEEEQILSMELMPPFRTPIRLYHRHLLASGRASVDFASASELDLDNLDVSAATIHLNESTSVEEPATPGWSVTSRFKDGVMTLEAKGQAPSSTMTEPRRMTKMVAMTRTCGGRTRCLVVTLTLHLAMEGECVMLPIVNALGKADIGCLEGHELKIVTSETTGFREKWCPYKVKSCRVRTPVYGEDGRPKTMVVFVTVDLDRGRGGEPRVEVASDL